MIKYIAVNIFLDDLRQTPRSTKVFARGAYLLLLCTTKTTLFES
jgi:hypothetical protein